MMYIRRIRKALTPIVISAVLAGLALVGIGEDMTVAQAVTTAVTAFGVWLIPNDA